MSTLRLKPGIGRNTTTAFVLLMVFIVCVEPSPAQIYSGKKRPTKFPTVQAQYTVRTLTLSPPRLAVGAKLPINGTALKMDTTWSLDVPEVDNHGWPALVRNLSVKDEMGRALEFTSKGSAGWELKELHNGWIAVSYEVDYSGPAAKGWPAPRETAFADPSHFMFVGRSLFITTPDVSATSVRFDLPRPWHPVTPWKPTTKSAGAFSVKSASDLVGNLIVLTRSNTDVINAGGFRVSVTLMGHWVPARSDVDKLMHGVIPRFVAMMKYQGGEDYSVILLPILDRGGESYRNSFAFNVETPPLRANRATWGHTIAHEIFHYWNGWRMQGATYQTSQWFQEGFTEYAADSAMVSSGLITADEFLQQLSGYMRKYKGLTTSLEKPGTHKGPPLYSGGALVAFCWDVQIRQATSGRRNFGDFMRALWQQTDKGKREYEWRDIEAALNSTAPDNWDAFFKTYIRGTEPLPIDKTLSIAGLRRVTQTDGSIQVEPDPTASLHARSLWRALMMGR